MTDRFGASAADSLRGRIRPAKTARTVLVSRNDRRERRQDTARPGGTKSVEVISESICSFTADIDVGAQRLLRFQIVTRKRTEGFERPVKSAPAQSTEFSSWPGERAFHPAQQLPGTKRFGYVIIGPSIETNHARELARHTGQHDNRNVRSRTGLHQAPARRLS